VEPEAKARQNIDALLEAAGWIIQDRLDLNLGAARAVAVREFPLKTGEADYLLFVDRKPGSETPWIQKLWIYDLRTNQHFTLRTNPMRYEDLQDFVKCYHPENRHDRTETEQFRAFTYDELMQRDKVSLDIFWLKDESLEDMENLPAPDVLAAEIVENLRAALEQFGGIVEDLGGE